MRKYIIAFCCLLLAGTGFTQDVVNVNRPYVLLNLSPASGLKSGEIYTIVRTLPSGSSAEVGKVKILFFREELCASEIIEEDIIMEIKPGDRVDVSGIKLLSRGNELAESNLSVQYPEFNFLKSPWVSYSTVGAGLVAAGFSYYYYDKAAGVADTRAKSIAHYIELTDEVNRYDKRSNTLQVVSGGLIVLGVIHYFFIREANLPEDQRLTLISTQRNGVSAVGVEFAIGRSRK